MLRRLAEFLSRGVTLRRRLPLAHGRGTVFVSPDASLRFWLPGLTRTDDLLAWVDEFVRPGSVVWDVGANVGVFATAAAFRAGPDGSVVMVEPDPWLSGLLERTIAAQADVAPMRLVSAAVAENPGTATLCVATRGRAANHLAKVSGSSQAGGARHEIVVETVSLDSLLNRFGAPTLVKIDVEGSEVSALRGARRLLTQVRPVVLCEVDDDSRSDVAGVLLGCGYEMYDASIPASERRLTTSPAWNTLALPTSTAVQ